MQRGDGPSEIVQTLVRPLAILRIWLQGRRPTALTARHQVASSVPTTTALAHAVETPAPEHVAWTRPSLVSGPSRRVISRRMYARSQSGDRFRLHARFSNRDGGGAIGGGRKAPGIKSAPIEAL